MKPITRKFNSMMMEGLQNIFAYSKYSRNLYRYMDGCRPSEQWQIKRAVFGVLETWSAYFDRNQERFINDQSDFWHEIQCLAERIESRLEDFGFDNSTSHWFNSDKEWVI